jgi:cytochrome c biogenesis protein CcmG, thiol:disulfide interchange protein DsbE
MIRTLLAALALALALGLGLTAQAADAPDFELKDLDGDEVAMSDLLDTHKLVVIDFWEVGCKPCNELLPHLQDYYDEYGEKGVEFIIISRDTALTQAQVEPYFRSKDYSFRVLLDGDREVSKDFGVKACPYTFIVNSEGKIIFSHFGYKPGQEEEVKAVIEKALAGEELPEVEAGDEAVVAAPEG